MHHATCFGHIERSIFLWTNKGIGTTISGNLPWPKTDDAIADTTKRPIIAIIAHNVTRIRELLAPPGCPCKHVLYRCSPEVWLWRLRRTLAAEICIEVLTAEENKSIISLSGYIPKCMLGQRCIEAWLIGLHVKVLKKSWCYPEMIVYSDVTAYAKIWHIVSFGRDGFAGRDVVGVSSTIVSVRSEYSNG